MRGQQTPADKVAEFRAQYLRLANASAAAREVDLPISTGADLAKKAEADPEFVKIRDEQYARALTEIDALALDTIQHAHAEATGPPPEPEIPERFNGTINIQDARVGWAKIVIDGLRAMSQHRRLLAESAGAEVGPREITITVVPRAGQGSDGETA